MTGLIGIYTVLLILFNLLLFALSLYVGRANNNKTTMEFKIISIVFLLNVFTLFGGLVTWVF